MCTWISVNFSSTETVNKVSIHCVYTLHFDGKSQFEIRSIPPSFSIINNSMKILVNEIVRREKIVSEKFQPKSIQQKNQQNGNIIRTISKSMNCVGQRELHCYMERGDSACTEKLNQTKEKKWAHLDTERRNISYPKTNKCYCIRVCDLDDVNYNICEIIAGQHKTHHTE